MDSGNPTIRFRLDRHSGLPVYRQLVNQVRHGIQIGVLRAGDKLPSVREVVSQIAVNPNTVHKAYREMEAIGMVRGEAGVGTFVSAQPQQWVAQDLESELRAALEAWIANALSSGLSTSVIVSMLNQASTMLEQRVSR